MGEEAAVGSIHHILKTAFKELYTPRVEGKHDTQGVDAFPTPPASEPSTSGAAPEDEPTGVEVPTPGDGVAQSQDAGVEEGHSGEQGQFVVQAADGSSEAGPESRAEDAGDQRPESDDERRLEPLTQADRAEIDTK